MSADQNQTTAGLPKQPLSELNADALALVGRGHRLGLQEAVAWLRHHADTPAGEHRGEAAREALKVSANLMEREHGL